MKDDLLFLGCLYSFSHFKHARKEKTPKPFREDGCAEPEIFIREYQLPKASLKNTRKFIQSLR